MQNADGREMPGPYHTGGLPWDKFEFANARFAPSPDGVGFLDQPFSGIQIVGYAGAMIQPHLRLNAPANAGKIATVAEGNFSRSRHAFEILRTASNHRGSEIWRDVGDLFGNRPGSDGKWLTPIHQHGYGGRPLLKPDGTLWMENIGGRLFPWFIYERVTKQMVEITSSGPRYWPIETKIFAARMKNLRHVFRPGERLPNGQPAFSEIGLVDIKSPTPNAEPYPATDRHGMGHLVEGGNPKLLDFYGEKFWLIVFSSGNYVDQTYGINLAYRHESIGPIGPYTPVIENGDLKNFGAEFSKKFNLTWGLSRADIFNEGDWMIAHAVDVDKLPAGFKISGWPEPNQFDEFHRNLYLLPIKLSLRTVEGRIRTPWLEIAI